MRTARVMASLADAPMQVPQEQVRQGQSPENGWADAAVKVLKIRTCDLAQPETTWKDSVRARTWQEDATASAKSLADAGAEACEHDQFGKSMAKGHILGIFGARVGV